MTVCVGCYGCALAEGHRWSSQGTLDVLVISAGGPWMFLCTWMYSWCIMSTYDSSWVWWIMSTPCEGQCSCVFHVRVDVLSMFNAETCSILSLSPPRVHLPPHPTPPTPPHPMFVDNDQSLDLNVVFCLARLLRFRVLGQSRECCGIRISSVHKQNGHMSSNYFIRPDFFRWACMEATRDRCAICLSRWKANVFGSFKDLLIFDHTAPTHSMRMIFLRTLHTTF